MLARGASPWEPNASHVRKAPVGATEPSIVLPPLQGLAIGLWHPVQGLAPLAKYCRPVPGLGTTRLDAQNRREGILALTLTEGRQPERP